MLSSGWVIQALVILLTTIFALRLYASYAYSYWKKRGISYLEPCFPYGNVKDNILLRKSTSAVMADAYEKAKDKKYVGIYTFFQPMLLIKDLDLIKSVLVKDFSHFVDRGVYYNEEDPCSAHLFSLEGQKWKNLRSRLSPTFTSGKIKLMFKTLGECVSILENHMLDSARSGTDVDMKETLKRFSLSVIANITLGIEMKTLTEDNGFTKAAFQATEPNFLQYIRVAFVMLCKDIANTLRIKSLPKDATDYFLKTIKDIVAFRKETCTKRNDFMQILIDLRDGVSDINEEIKNKGTNGENLTFNELVAQVFLFVVAGYETASTTLSYCLYELAMNPDIQDNLRKEVQDAGVVSYDKLNDLPYLEMVLNETLRKYPPVGFLQRLCVKDYELEEGTLSAGTLVMLPVRATQNDTRYFPDPDKFNPERFNKESPAHPVLPFSYLPFGEGPRFCIGMRFGKLQAKLTLFKLISRFTFNVSDKTLIPPEEEPKNFVLNPKAGMYLTVSEI